MTNVQFKFTKGLQGDFSPLGEEKAKEEEYNFEAQIRVYGTQDGEEKWLNEIDSTVFYKPDEIILENLEQYQGLGFKTIKVEIWQWKDGHSKLIRTFDPLVLDDYIVDYLDMFNPQKTSQVNFDEIKTKYPNWDNFLYAIKVEGDTAVIDTEIAPGPLQMSFPNSGTVFGPSFAQCMSTYATADPSCRYPSTKNFNDNYNLSLFKMSMDRRINNLSLSKFEKMPYNEACDYLANEKHITDKIKQTEIYLTYHLKTVNTIYTNSITFNGKSYAWNGEQLKYVSKLSNLLQKCIDRIYTVDYFTWAPIATLGGSGGCTLAFSLPIISPSNAAGTINMEAVAPVATFNPLNPADVGNTVHKLHPYPWHPTDTYANAGWPAKENYSDIILSYNPPDIPESAFTQGSDDNICYAVADTIVHELGHNVCSYGQFLTENGLRCGLSQQWLTVGHWTKSLDDYAQYSNYQLTGNTIPPTEYKAHWQNPNAFQYDIPLSVYGGTHPVEDWAECFSCYIFNRDFFRKYFPHKYNVMTSFLNKMKDYKLYDINKGVQPL